MSTNDTIIQFQLAQNKARVDRELAKRSAIREAEAARSSSSVGTAPAVAAPMAARLASAAAPPSGCSESTATNRGVATGRSV